MKPKYIYCIDSEYSTNIYVNDQYEILTNINKNKNIHEIIKTVYEKHLNQNPSQLYLHSDEFDKCRLNNNEVALLINQNLIDYDDKFIDDNDFRFHYLIDRVNLSYDCDCNIEYLIIN